MYSLKQGSKMYGFSKKRFLILAVMICFVLFTFIACPTDTPPPSPSPIVNEIIGDIVQNNDGSMTISWDAVTGAITYEIYHGASRFTRNFSQLGEVSASSGRRVFTHDNPNLARFENYYRIIAWNANFEIVARGYISLRLQYFGPTVLFFDAQHDTMADIVAEINRIHDTETLGSLPQADGRIAAFGGRRYIFFFMPGDYNLGGATIRIGFYTHIAGLGRLPSDTRLINATVSTPTHLVGNNATTTFWRSIENLEITSGNFQWGVSQSASMRRMLVRSPAAFHYNNGEISGGFTADSWFSSVVAGASQQQWYTRNTHYAQGMTGVVWNNTIQASTGNLPPNNPDGVVTIIETSPIIREKPFLYVNDDGEFRVFVPGVRTNAVGISWNDGSDAAGMNIGAENGGMGPGKSLDFLETFYITRTRIDGEHHIGLDNAASINAQLAQGKNIFFTPGRFDIEAPIIVSNPDTIILGKGFPALWPTRNNRHGVMFVEDVPGVTIAGLLFDTTDQSVYSLTIGHTGAHLTSAVLASNPILLADLTLRVGGQFIGPNHVDISLLVNSNNVIGDKLWIWRADHSGLPNEINGIDWHINTSINGLVVFGNDVHMYGLFVEHYHQYNTLWLGERGRIFFYQNETPYDPHFQHLYMSHNGETRGWAQLKVDNRVTDFRAYSLGMYSVFLDRINGTREPILLQNAIEVPHRQGVVITKAVIVNIGSNNNGGIESIVNGVGGSVLNGFGTARISSFSDGVAVVAPGTSSGAGTSQIGTVNAVWQPPNETHWVEALVVGSNGIVTANPNGGLPSFSIQYRR